MIEADDAYTGQHTQDVVELTVAVADRLGVERVLGAEPLLEPLGIGDVTLDDTLHRPEP